MLYASAFLCGLCRPGEHSVDKNAVARGGVADEHMGDGAYQQAILHNGGAAQECCQVGTTLFFIKSLKPA